MFADIYKTCRSNIFVLVPRGASLASIPTEIMAGLGHPLFLGTREISDPGFRADAFEIISELSSKGFSLRKT
jgi:hypothetical protein